MKVSEGGKNLFAFLRGTVKRGTKFPKVEGERVTKIGEPRFFEKIRGGT